MPPPVVGIGASAGGLGALKALLAEVPEDSGVAWVVVVHLSPEHESHMAQLLQPFSAIPVEQAMQTVLLEPDRVYVIPPNANLEAIDTHLRLGKLEERRRERAPIDHTASVSGVPRLPRRWMIVSTAGRADGAYPSWPYDGGIIMDRGADGGWRSGWNHLPKVSTRPRQGLEHPPTFGACEAPDGSIQR